MGSRRSPARGRPVRVSRRAVEGLHRLNLDREQVRNRLWEIANLSPELNRGSITGQVKAISNRRAVDPRAVSSEQGRHASNDSRAGRSCRLSTREPGWGRVSVPGHALRCGPETSVTSPLRWLVQQNRCLASRRGRGNVGIPKGQTTSIARPVIIRAIAQTRSRLNHDVLNIARPNF